MLDKRERYLDLMGIDTYQLRQPEKTPADVVMAEEKPIKEDSVATSELLTIADNIDVSNRSISSHAQDIIESGTQADNLLGLRFMTGKPDNGLLVVLPSVAKDLTSEARQLLSNMLNSIQCQPSASGFAESGTETADSHIPNEGVRSILFLDYETGKRFIDHNGALREPGEDYCILRQTSIVVSIHPQELITTPELKAVAWKDLKLVAKLLQN